jgi:aminoglycoside phosphotransferase (APT) family kinase protein
MMIEMGCYAREAWFYESLAAGLRMPTPRGLYCAVDGSGNGVAVMDDLIERGARLWTCAEPASIEEVGRGLEALACLHAADPATAAKAGIPLRPTIIGEAALQWTNAFDADYLAREIGTGRGADMPEYAKHPELVISSYNAMIAELGQRPEVLLHGDCHPGNTFTDHDGQVGFYDWQTISLGPWAFDVSYFITASLAVEDRRRAEAGLLQRYFAAFAAAGGTPPPRDQAWRDYRKYIAYGLYVWMSVPHAYQLPAASTALTTRFSVAAHDFELFALWNE